MPTFKAVVLQTYRRQDGTYNVKIRVTHKRVSRYIPTPFYVSQEQMTRGFRIKDVSLMDKLEERIRVLRKNSDRLGFLTDGLDVDHLIKIINSDGDNTDFFAYMESYIDKLENYRSHTRDIYTTALNSLRKFACSKTLPFSSITKSYILKYWESTNNLKTNTRRSYLICIKTVYKHAQKELNDDDSGIIIAKHGVFDLIDIPKMETRNDLAFDTIEQMQSVIDSPYTGNWTYDFAKDLFVFSFVCFGMNYADILRLEKSQYKNGIITYRRKKTEVKMRCDAEQQIKICDVGKIIISKYNGDAKYLFDFKGHSRRQELTRAIHATFQNAGVEEKTESYLGRAGHIRGKYVFYTARHSMATFARNICHIDKLTVHEMLNHATPQDMKMTDVYLKKDYSHIWDANEKLLSLFDWSFYMNQKKD